MSRSLFHEEGKAIKRPWKKRSDQTRSLRRKEEDLAFRSRDEVTRNGLSRVLEHFDPRYTEYGGF